MKPAIAILLLAAAAAVVSGAAVNQDSRIVRNGRMQKIVGGSITTINEYPYGVAMLYNIDGQLATHIQWCGGSILTTRTILSAAHCYYSFGLWDWHQGAWWRARVGSTYASSGGTVMEIDRFAGHPQYQGHDYDIALARTASPIIYITDTVAPASISGPNYHLADNEAVWAIGWGAYGTGESSEELRHVQVYTINQEICIQRYATLLTDNMLCSGILDVGGRDQCGGDSGGPLLHNNVIVGICAWGFGCADPYYPGVNMRVSRFTDWIVATSDSLQ